MSAGGNGTEWFKKKGQILKFWDDGLGYMAEVKPKHLTDSRSVLEDMVANATEGKHNKRAEFILQSFKNYEESFNAYNAEKNRCCLGRMA